MVCIGKMADQVRHDEMEEKMLKVPAKKLADGFWWTGVLDPDLRVFDIVMHTEFGTTYNAYVLKGTEKTVLFESSKDRFTDEWLERVESVVPLSEISHIIATHTEPDHSGSIEELVRRNPDIEVIGTMGAINFLKEIICSDFKSRTVKKGDTLDIGGYTLEFMPAPNLHWPDTMFTYVPQIKALITCDCFGSHYSDENVTNDRLASREDYMKATLYYYDNIMGPFKADVLKAIEMIKDLDVEIIATGHGPVLTDDPRSVVELYRRWSEPAGCSCDASGASSARKKVVIPYVSAYGYTRKLADAIAEGIREAGDIDVYLHDMVYTGIEEAMKDIADADGFLLGTPTVVGEALPLIWEVASALNAKIHGGKYASAFGSYGWSGEGVPHIMQRLSQLKLKIVGEGFRIRFKPCEQEIADAKEFGKRFGTEMLS
jgi:flavorubredoxin